MEIIGLIALWIGVGFCVIGVLGIVRMPDLYCRLHASGKVGTVGLCGLLVGAAMIVPSTTMKLIALAVFAVLTLPASSHAIAAAAYRHGILPQSKSAKKPAVSVPALDLGTAEEESYAA